MRAEALTTADIERWPTDEIAVRLGVSHDSDFDYGFDASFTTKDKAGGLITPATVWRFCPTWPPA